MGAIYFFFEKGQVHINRNGNTYTVVEVISQIELVLLRSDGWQLTAHNPQIYPDKAGLRMEWDSSTGGHFTKVL